MISYSERNKVMKPTINKLSKETLERMDKFEAIITEVFELLGEGYKHILHEENEKAEEVHEKAGKKAVELRTMYAKELTKSSVGGIINQELRNQLNEAITERDRLRGLWEQSFTM